MKKENNYLISVFLLMFIISIMLSYFLMTSKEIKKIPTIDINGEYKSKEIYDILQLNYDTYINDSVLKTEIDSKKYVEVYIASKSQNSTENIDYLYYCNDIKDAEVSFYLYRSGELIDSYTIERLKEKSGIISFKGVDIQLEDSLKVKINVNGKTSQEEILANFYYENGLIKHKQTE